MSARSNATASRLWCNFTMIHAREGLHVRVQRRLSHVRPVVLPDCVTVCPRCKLLGLRVLWSLSIQAAKDMAFGADTRLKRRVHRLLVFFVVRREVDVRRLPYPGVRRVRKRSVNHPGGIGGLITVLL